MANEGYFLLHIGLILVALMGALRLGKEALVSLIALLGVIANLFVLKQMTLFGMDVTCADVYIVGCTLGLNLLQEHFGHESAKKATTIAFLSLLIFGLMSQMHLFYRPNFFDTTQSAYSRLLTAQPRILIASLTAYFLSQRLDVQLFGILKRTKLPFTARSGISLLICQGVDTLLFTFLGLYGLVTSCWDVVIVAYTIKVGVILLATPASAILRRAAQPSTP